MKGTKYKVINTDGSIAYYASNSSPHLYGEAFDFIGSSLDGMISTIQQNDHILYLM